MDFSNTSCQPRSRPEFKSVRPQARYIAGRHRRAAGGTLTGPAAAGTFRLAGELAEIEAASRLGP
jgi:hypothetical protein